MSELPDTAPARDGMPMLGLGTYRNDDHDQCVESVRTALDLGYRHVDTAQAYGNERAVGEGIAAADVPREDVFLATKVWIDSLAAEDVRRTTEASLDRLGVDSVDILYVHWPADTYAPEETLPAFERLHEDGLVDRIGVSNFEPGHLERARAVLDAPIFADQVECHPLLQQEELRSVCADRGIEVIAYSPVARGRVTEVPEVVSVAERHDATPYQVALAWLREKGITAIPKATSAEHIRENWASLALDLNVEDVERIDGIDRQERLVDPGFAPAGW